MSKQARNVKLMSVMFGGQGSQYLGMSRSLFLNHDLVGRSPTLQQMQQILQRKHPQIYRMITFDTATTETSQYEQLSKQLTLTRNAQPAILAHSAALWALLKERAHVVQWEEHVHDPYVADGNVGDGHVDEVMPRIVLHSVLGHSLGEYIALVANEAISFEDAMHLVQKRGELMEECVYDNDHDKEQFGMSAMLNTSAEELKEIIEDLAQRSEYDHLVCDLANLNTEEQIVISGHQSMIDAVSRRTKERNNRARAIALNVGAPFHSSLLRPAATSLRPFLNNLSIWKNRQQLATPVISNVTASFVSNVDDEVQLLEKQVYMPVRWFESALYCCHMLQTAVQDMNDRGKQGKSKDKNPVEPVLLEISPKPVLLPLIRRTKSIEPQLIPPYCQTITNAEQLLIYFQDSIGPRPL